jgi:hypothetical protein
MLIRYTRDHLYPASGWWDCWDEDPRTWSPQQFWRWEVHAYPHDVKTAIEQMNKNENTNELLRHAL